MQPWGTDPYLGKTVSFTERMHHITNFGAMVRTGELGHGKQIRVGSVRTAITAIAQTIALDRGETPLHNELGEYHAPLNLMLDGFKKEDPPSEKKLAVGIDIPEYCCEQGFKSKTAKGLAIGDLIIIAFYFLLRIGEYTVKRTKNDTKRTVQFRMMDVIFSKRRGMAGSANSSTMPQTSKSCERTEQPFDCLTRRTATRERASIKSITGKDISHLCAQ